LLLYMVSATIPKHLMGSNEKKAADLLQGTLDLL